MADDSLQRKCDLYELLYLRATEGARAANVGIERLKWKVLDLQGDLEIAHGALNRLRRENDELEKKVARLSLRILKEWGENR